ncbi:MAG: glucose-1-phosphate adenylyltransferase subunit GlgD [Eubacteriales bacterium]|nr:glucose-1-phosphate adenylyltransferase subunit GlgD [Eubacteriales bacterium]MDD4540687.1 glucose-1-phosphate adenylyltransferase subunit GlgD [Eubacteriales bacterium]
MFVNAMGLILADNQRVKLGPLSEPRALSAMPFGGRYRIIDFLLSNMVNSGIKRVGVIALTRYKSLMDHLGTGASWDLDRMNQGLFLLPPYINPMTRSSERSDLSSIIDYIETGSQDYVVITDCNLIMNTLYNDLLDRHIESGADITVMYNRDALEYGLPNISLMLDEEERLYDVLADSHTVSTEFSSINVAVVRKDLLLSVLEESRSRGVTDFTFLRLLEFYKQLEIKGCEHKGKVFRINSMANYFKASMSLFDDDLRHQLFSEVTPIYTKVKNQPPCLVEPGSRVNNVLASDGCIIQGDVENCVLFRGVTVGKGAKLRNSVIFQNTQISNDADLNHVIIDKDSVVKMGVRLLGHPGFPVVIGKGSIV